MTAVPVDDPVQVLERMERLRRLEVSRATGEPPRVLLDHQRSPLPPWYVWLLLGGRGSGKTEAAADYFDRWMRQHPGARGSIVAPTIGDALEACIYGPSGLMVRNPNLSIATRRGGTNVMWPNRSEARLFGTHTRDDIERLRAGGNRGIVWAEELAAWRHLDEAWTHMEYGLRVGERPHVVASTTPKTRPALRRIMESPETIVTRAATFDNPHLPQAQRDRLRAKYEGTRIGRQELHGEYIEDVEGALWAYETLDGCRVSSHPDLVRVVVAVDPSGTDSDGNSEQGIVVAGRGIDGRGYVLADRSCLLSPDGWGRRAVRAYTEFGADRVVAEGNFGGDMVISIIRSVAQAEGVEVATKKITASRGKVARAEPVAALYEQGRVSHVGTAEDFEQLEFQQRQWTQDAGWSPDRLDAVVWALTELLLDPRNEPVTMTVTVPRGRIPTQADRFRR